MCIRDSNYATITREDGESTIFRFWVKFSLIWYHTWVCNFIKRLFESWRPKILKFTKMNTAFIIWLKCSLNTYPTWTFAIFSKFEPSHYWYPPPYSFQISKTIVLCWVKLWTSIPKTVNAFRKAIVRHTLKRQTDKCRAVELNPETKCLDQAVTTYRLVINVDRKKTV